MVTVIRRGTFGDRELVPALSKSTSQPVATPQPLQVAVKLGEAIDDRDLGERVHQLGLNLGMSVNACAVVSGRKNCPVSAVCWKIEMRAAVLESVKDARQLPC